MTLDTANAQPTARFKALLALRINYHFLMGRLFAPPYVYYMPLFTLLLIVPSLIFGPDVYAFLRVQYVKSTTDTTSIYQQAMQKQPQSVGERATMATSDMALEPAQMIYPGRAQDGSNYFFHQTHTTHGPQSATCQAYTYWDNDAIQSYTSTTISFHTDEAYYNKSVTTDEYGSPFEYYLSTPDAVIEYKGGEYAIKNNSMPIYMSMGISLMSPEEIMPEAERENITDYDLPIQYDPQPAPELIMIEKIDGVEYYVYQTKYDIYCGGENSQTGVQRSWINLASQDVYKDQTYLNSVSADNLLVESIYTNEVKNVTFEEIASHFEFEYDVPVREAPEQDTPVQLENYLNQHPVEVLLPTSPDWQLTYAYSEAASDSAYRTSHIFDRAYYPSNAIGEAMYQQFQSTAAVFPAAELELQFVDTDGAFTTITTYSEPTALGSILAYHALQNTTPTNVQITINGQTQTALAYEFENISPGYSRALAPEDMTLPYEGNPAPTIIFERNGFIYVLRVHDYSANEFDVITTANDQQRQQLLTRIQNTLRISSEGAGSTIERSSL